MIDFAAPNPARSTYRRSSENGISARQNWWKSRFFFIIATKFANFAGATLTLDEARAHFRLLREIAMLTFC